MNALGLIGGMALIVCAFVVYEAWQAHKREQGRRWS